MLTYFHSFQCPCVECEIRRITVRRTIVQTIATIDLFTPVYAPVRELDDFNAPNRRAERLPPAVTRKSRPVRVWVGAHCRRTS